VLQWARSQTTLHIVDDQIGSPTSARMLAEATSQVIAQGRGNPFDYIYGNHGLYHLAGLGCVNRYDWTKEILELNPNRAEQTIKELIPAKTAEFPLPAKRPLYSGLDCIKFANASTINFPDWWHALKLTIVNN
jgi:dTDP-4-dehydrorhamnose reductase